MVSIPRTYAELEATVKRWIATCVMSRTPVGGVPVRRENELVTGNPSLVHLWDTLLKNMVGQEVKLLAEYMWSRQGTDAVRFSIATTYVNFPPEDIVVRRPVPPKPVPVPPHAKPPTVPRDRVPPKPPPPPKKPDRPPRVIPPRPPRIIEDFRNQPNQPPGSSRNWALDALKAAAVFLGTTISVGVRALSTVELELALEGAWVAFQIGFQLEKLELQAVTGLAGEFAAEAVLPRLLGINPENVFGLNLLAENAPVFDLLTPGEATSVKVIGVLSNPAGKTRQALKSAYKKFGAELMGMETPFKGSPKFQKAVNFIWNNRAQIPKEAFPKGLRSIQQLETFLKEHGRLRVLHDHVPIAREALGDFLMEQIGDPRHISAADARRIQKITFEKIDTIGLTTKDLEQMLEASKHLPAKETTHMQSKAEAWRRRVRNIKK